MSTAEKLDWLIADQLKAELTGAAIIGREIIVLKETGSTNDAILQFSSTHIPPAALEGLVLFAEHQTTGRGQRGNRWESTMGKGLCFSILLRPALQLRDSGRLTVWAVEAISDAIRAEFGVEPVTKLPNDIQLFGRKVAGVLVEMRAQENAPHLAVVGIGINANQSRDDLPVKLQDRAISLAMAIGREVDRQKLAVTLLRNLDLTYRERFSIGIEAVNSFPAPTTTRDKPAARFRTV
jgi:BirA family biotin operon repressor/biotin-[acetyl-CoA-carboxylase] ligase